MTTKVDHDYPTPGNLSVTDEDTGLPIKNVRIRVYAAASYPPAGDEYSWTGATVTDSEGKWLDPLYLPDGTDWVVSFNRNLTYAEKTVEIST